MSKFNSEISFLCQLFKEDSNFIVIKVIQGYLSAFYDVFDFIFIYTYIYTPSNQHFKAFPVSKFNSKTSYLYQLFKKNSNFKVWKPCKVIYLSIFKILFFSLSFTFIHMFIYAFIHLHINNLKPSSVWYQFWDKFSVSTFQGQFKFYCI